MNKFAAFLLSQRAICIFKEIKRVDTPKIKQIQSISWIPRSNLCTSSNGCWNCRSINKRNNIFFCSECGCLQDVELDKVRKSNLNLNIHFLFRILISEIVYNHFGS